jgi:hypothetical protein
MGIHDLAPREYCHTRGAQPAATQARSGARCLKTTRKTARLTKASVANMTATTAEEILASAK